MRIAVLASVTTVVPPQGQSSVERLAFHQVVGLADRGHQITLYAPDGSNIRHPQVKIIEIGQPVVSATYKGLSKQQKPEEIYGGAYKLRLRFANVTSLFIHLLSSKRQHDVILNNLVEEAPLLSTHPLLKIPLYHVLHVPIIPEVAQIYRQHKARLISISNSQRELLPDLNYCATVYNGVDTNIYTYSDNPGDYVLYLGSIGRNKNPKDAILAAKLADIPIVIGGNIKDESYYNKEIVPLVDGKRVRWIGEINQTEVIKLYQGAKAFLFPTLWSEPFGLVAIEALSCGTPVIAYPNGGLTEIVEDGTNGFFVKNVEQMAEKIHELNKIDRHACRLSAEKNFSIEKMIAGYEHVLMSAELP